MTQVPWSTMTIQYCEGDLVLERSDSPGVFWLLVCATAVVIAVTALYPARVRQKKVRAECVRLSEEMERLTAELMRLQDGERRLRRGEPAIWSAFARSKLGWHPPGERTVAATSRTDGTAWLVGNHSGTFRGLGGAGGR